MIRDHNLKIPDIKVFRSLTRLLGKLGLDTCRTHNPPLLAPWAYSSNYPEYQIGFGLKETKDLVERTFLYGYIKNSPLDQFQKGNMIHEIKRTRQLMGMLNKFGLKTPDTGLRTAKDFVDRMRARPR